MESSNCATAVPLNEPDLELSLPANKKRAGSSSGTTYKNVASKNLMKMGFTQKRFKKNKPNEHRKERVDEGGTEGNNASGDTESGNVDRNDFPIWLTTKVMTTTMAASILPRRL